MVAHPQLLGMGSLLRTTTTTTHSSNSSSNGQPQQQRRALFLEEYIASNCTIQFDPSFAVDDTVGTFVTNYAIGGVGIFWGILFVVVKLCRCRRRQGRSQREQEEELLDIQQKQKRIEWTWQAVYFFLSAIGYTIAGIQHQIFRQTDDVVDAVLYTGPILIMLSAVALQLSVTETWRLRQQENGEVSEPTPMPCLQRPCTIVLIRLLYATAVVTVGTLTVVLQSLTVVGIYTFAALALITLYYLGCFTRCHCSCNRYLEAWGNCLILAGLLVQVLLAPLCGPSEAYENCFRDCPLPTDPLTFNHNALFHVLVAIGMVFQGIGWWNGWADTRTATANTTTTTNNIVTTSNSKTPTPAFHPDEEASA